MNQSNEKSGGQVPAIRTWRERIGANPAFPLHAPNDVERAMEAEIADLRARIDTAIVVPSRAYNPLDTPEFRERLDAYTRAMAKASLFDPASVNTSFEARKNLTDFLEAWCSKFTITLSGHQLRMALDLINPDGPTDEDQLDDYLYFGVRQHKDDNGKIDTGMCCWNDDTDGVLPLDGEYVAPRPSHGTGDK